MANRPSVSKNVVTLRAIVVAKANVIQPCIDPVQSPSWVHTRKQLRIIILKLIYDFISFFSLWFQFRLRRYIKHSRQCLFTFPNTSKFVENTPLRVVCSATRRIFNSVLGVWKCEQTQSFECDILLTESVR